VTHVFLTGDRGVGKTTVVTKIVDRLVKDGAVAADEIAGFRTVWMAAEDGAEGVVEALYILPYVAGSTGAGFPDAGHADAPGSRGGVYPGLRSPDAANGCGGIPGGARPVAERVAGKQTLAVCPEVFDEDGVALLRAATSDFLPLPAATNPPQRKSPANGGPRAKIIVMDELGFMELPARAFTEAVMRALDGEVPVLGVLRKDSNPFLDAVGTHPKVRVVEVTEANRDALPAGLTYGFFHD
jgi:nucleoside-triphosphatase THEP1